MTDFYKLTAEEDTPIIAVNDEKNKYNRRERIWEQIVEHIDVEGNKIVEVATKQSTASGRL